MKNPFFSVNKIGLLLTLFIKFKFFVSLLTSISIKRAFTEVTTLNKVALSEKINVKSKCSLISSNELLKFFVPKTSEDQTYVLHLDRVRDNDDYRNLKWATRAEMIEHSKASPFVKQAKLNLIEHNLKADGRKLTVTKVMLIKKMLARPDQKTRMKMIAKQFGVSEMQISRIKSGENWSQVKI